MPEISTSKFSRIPEYIWNFLENHPWLFMTVAVLAQTWFTLNNRALWFSDEVRYGNAYQNLIHHGNWLVLSLNGMPYPDKPPVYFWFLWLIDTLTPADMPTVFFIGAALSGLFFLFAAYALAKALGFNRRTSLISTTILLSTLFLMALFHYSRMDLLFGACITASHACFFRAFSSDQQGKWPIGGFAMAGLATLIKGPLGFLFPLVTILIWLVWRGRVREMFSKPMLKGLGVMLGMLLLWIGGVIITQGPSFLLNTVIGKQIVQRATHTFHHREPLLYYFIALPLAWLPWTLLPFALPLKRLVSPGFWGTAVKERTNGNGKSSFLWIMFLGMFTFLSSLSGKVLIYILPMFPAMALLSAQALASTDTRHTRRFWTFVAGFLVLLGMGMFVGADFAPVQTPVRGLALGAAILCCGGILLFMRRSAPVSGNLLCLVLTVIVWMYPIGLLTAPSLDPAMSPKAEALLIKQYVDKGYTPMSYKIYSGIFTYYAQHDLAEIDHLDEIEKRIAETDKVVLAIRKRHWDDWENRPAYLIPVHEQIISGDTYLLVVGNRIAGS